MDGGFLLVLLIASVVFGVIGGAISDARSAGFGVGFAAGALLGPIGLAIAFLVPSRPDLAASAERAMGNAKVCPRCAETVKAAATVCRFCGHEFQETELVLGAPAPATGGLPAVDPDTSFTSYAILGICGLFLLVAIAVNIFD